MLSHIRVLALFFISFSLFIISCGTDQDKEESIPADVQEIYNQYITAHTNGVIRSDKEILIKLSLPVPDERRINDLFDFYPHIPGDVQWIDQQTILFTPADELKLNTSFEADFHLGKLFTVDPKAAKFHFSFRTIQQNMRVLVDNVITNKDNGNEVTITGQIKTAELTGISALKQKLNVLQDNRNLSIKLATGDSPTHFLFQITGVKRKINASEVVLSWEGKNSGERRIAIPEKGAFKLVDMNVVRDKNPYLKLSFSNQLDQKQNINGLIRLNNKDITSYFLDRNTIRVYPEQNYSGPVVVSVDASIRDADGQTLSESFERRIQFAMHKPEVAFAGSNVIVPKTDGDIIIPFRTVALSGADIRISQIHQKNVAQFLQVNELDGDYQMKRVGSVIAQTYLKLGEPDDKSLLTWQSRTLNLSDFITTEPGTIYRIEIGFRQHHSVYPCEDESETNVEAQNELQPSPYDDPDYWSNFDSYNFDYSREGWQNREDPCHAGFYGYRRAANRNVLASDLGIIAKVSKEGSAFVAVTDMMTGNPLSDANIELLNYQQISLAKAQTDKDGFAQFTLDENPYFLMVKHQSQRGYLKLNDGNALSVSSFNVSGASVQDHLKGFLYGERGVWRPGDSLFVTLIVEDEKNTLPDEHPVIFELRNPFGQISDRKVAVKGKNGFYVYRHETQSDAPTGNWSLKATVGGTTFQKTVKIETVRPNRLKVNLDFSSPYITYNDRTLNATLSSTWLHGASAGGLKYDVNLTQYPYTPVFDGFESFSFKNPLSTLKSDPSTVAEGKLDSEGKASINQEFQKVSDLPQAIQLQLSARVFEESGGFSKRSFQQIYYPYTSVVGIHLPQLDEDERLPQKDEQTIQFVALSHDGEPKSFEKVSVRIYRLAWRWWWDQSSENLANFIERKNLEPVATISDVTKNNGLGEVTTDFGGRIWGRYLVVAESEESGAMAAQTVSFRWSGSGQQNEMGAAERLAISTDKDSYQSGETAKLSFPSFSNGRALVSIETNSSILETFWVNTNASSTTVSLDLDEEMAPNVYAHVTTLQPHSQRTNDRPQRMYGVIPIPVEVPQTRLNPAISMPDEIRPETDYQLTVSEENGVPMTYTIAVVDEGLLDITNFSTPQPWNHFYAKEALGVHTWDVYDDVAGPFTLSEFDGGGADGSERSAEARINRFKPVVQFIGPFTLGKGESQTHTLSMPNYVGSVKTMVVAGKDGAYGSASETTVVRKPLMVLGSAPRTLSPREEVTIPVSVFNMREGNRDVSVTIETNGIFEIIGENNTEVSFSEMGDKLTEFRLKVSDMVGVGKISINAESGSESASYEIEMRVKNPHLPMSVMHEHVLEPGESWQQITKTLGMEGTNTSTLELSTLPPLYLEERLSYLINYPHGCIEQTTSGIFAQLYLGELVDLTQNEKMEIQKNIDAGIKQMNGFQLSNGGLSYWPGNSYSSSWGSIYAFHFLTEAKELGYFVPDGLYAGLKRFIRQEVRNYRFIESQRSDLHQTYRLYTLALAGEPELGAMNRIRGKNYLSTPAQWRLSAAYALSSLPDIADDIVSNASVTVDNYRELSNTFGSALRDKAMILETLTMLNRPTRSFELLKEISRELSSKSWLSTQETAYSLLSVGKYAANYTNERSLMANVSYRSTNTSIESDHSVYQMSLDMDAGEEIELNLTNEGEQPLYAQIIQRGTPLETDAQETEYHLKQKVRYYSLDGEEIDPADLRQGEDVIVEVEVTHPGERADYKELALTHILPSGWEITNSRMDNISFAKPSSPSTYQDIRDDRVLTYFDLKNGETKFFRLSANASYAGRYVLPTIRTAAMYDEEIQATTPGGWINLTSK